MTSFLVDESILRRLSPAARRELLQLVSDDLISIRNELADLDWDVEGDVSFPLTIEEAEVLVRGIPEPAFKLLQVFTDNRDGETGTATLEQLLSASGYAEFQELGQQLSWLLLRLRTVTGNQDAWLVNWNTDDWEWDENQQTYVKGRYFISGPAITSLAKAIDNL